MFQSASEPKPGRNNRISPVLPPNLVSNPRPSRSPDETLHFDGSEACLESFNPRPSRSPDETRNPILHHQLNRVSIRVRAEARTKPVLPVEIKGLAGFQSASEPKPGRNSLPAEMCISVIVSIRVRAEARTKLPGREIPQELCIVSLRVRAEARTKHKFVLACTGFVEFQSASEPKPGRNVKISTHSRSPQSFNPRPSRSPDETCAVCSMAEHVSMFQSASEPKPGRNCHPQRFPLRDPCFNPRPSRSPDETEIGRGGGYPVPVSIRVRAEARTKLEIGHCHPSNCLFQSASEPKPGRNEV